MSTLKKIVYLTEQQYGQLAAGTLTGHPEGIQDDILYITTDVTSLDNLNGILSVNKGGTGTTTFTSGALLVGNGTAAITTINKTSDATGGTIVVRDSSGNFSAGTITANLSGNANTATTANYLAHKTLNSTSINNTAGSFAFSGSGAPWTGCDWVGIQIGDNVDKFQITAGGKSGSGGNILLYRQNDSGGTNTSWSTWQTVVHIAEDTGVGSATQPVYVNDYGSVTACTQIAIANGGTGLSSTTARYAFIGPSSNGAPTWRKLENADLPGSGQITIAGVTASLGGSISLEQMGLSSAMHYRGAVTADPTTTTPSGTYISGDVLVNSTNSKEFVYDGTNWREIGDESSYALSTHDHPISISAAGTATVTLAANTTYTLTAGGKSIAFKTPVDTTYSGEKGITLSSGKFGHTNSVTAQTTQAVYPITIDAQGHISAYGTAQTIISIGTTSANAMAGNTVVNKVKQTATTTAAAYKLLLTTTSAPSSGTNYEAYYSTTLTYNPNTKALVTGGTVDGLTLAPQTTGFKISGGTTSKTLTVGADYTLAAACAKAVLSTTSNFSSSGDLPTAQTVHNYVTNLGYLTSQYNTHIYVNATSSGATSNANTTNTTTYIHLYDDTTKRETLQITGSGASSVSSTGGKITINSVDTQNTAGASATTTKIFLIGAQAQSTTITYSNTAVFATDGVLSAKSIGINYNTTANKVTLQWNDTDSSLDFVFA